MQPTGMREGLGTPAANSSARSRAEIPNPKHQIPNKFKFSKSELPKLFVEMYLIFCFEHWNIGILNLFRI